MPYTTIVTGTTITSTWANESVRDQVVTPFASTAARSAAVTSPVTGMASTLTTNASTEGLYVYNSAAKWALPWNMAWGEIGYDEMTSDVSISTVTATAITGMSVTFTSVANRKYKVTISMGLGTTVNTQTLQFDLYSNTTAAQISVMPSEILASTTDLAAYSYSRRLSSPAAGSTTWVVRGYASGANAEVQGATGPATILIEDIGPNGAPT